MNSKKVRIRTPKKAADSSVRVLDKAFNILDFLSRLERDIDLAALNREMSIPKTTLLRLLNAMKKHNLVQQDEQTRRFQLGWALIHLGRAANRVFSLVEFIRPFLEKLSQETGETANLAFLDRNRAVYVDQVVSENIIRGVPSVGSPVGLHCTAAGKALLSSLPPHRMEALIGEIKLARHTEKTITDQTVLRRELARVRTQGYAIDNEESELGGCCVAAPIWGKEASVVASVSVMGPTARVNPESFPRLSLIVMAAAAEVSATLGYVPAGK